MAGEYSLSVIMNAQDKASNVVQSFLQKLGPVGGVVAGVSAVLVGVGAASVKMAGDFQASMIKSQAEAGLTKQQMTDMGNAILTMAPQVGQAPKALADGLFFVESAGFAGKDALNTLRLSAEMAANDMSDTSTVAKGLTAAVKAFGYQTSDSAMVANQMTVTVSSGKMTMSDYANVIGKTAQMAHNFHVGMSDTNAALDTLSNNGFPSAATAGTALQNVLQQFDGNTAKVAKNVKALGGTFDENKFKSMDLQHQVQYLSIAMKGHEDQLQHVLGGSKSAALGYNALKTGAAEYGKDLQKLNAAQEKGGAETQSFAATQQGFNFKMQQAQAATDVMMIKLGQYLIPILEQAGGVVADVVGNFANWVTTSNIVPNTLNAIGTAVQDTKNFINGTITVVQNIVKWFNDWKPVILGVAGAITLFFLPALIKVGVESAISGAKMAASFIANMVKTGIEAVVNGAKVAVNFVGSIITAGVEGWQSAGKLAIFIGQQIASGTQAVIAGAKIAVNYVGGLIASGAQAVLAGAKIAINFVGSMIASGAQAVLSGAKVVGSFVASMIATGTQAVLAAAKVTVSFIASMIMTGAKAVVSAALVVGSFVASLITTAAQAIVTGAIMFASLIPALLATAVAALAAAWPFLLVAAIIAVVVIGIILAIQHWGQIVAWLKGVWSAFSAWFQSALKGVENFFTGIWNGIKIFFQHVWDWIVSAAKIAALVLFVVITGPIGLLALYIFAHWTEIHTWLVNAWNILKSKAGEFVNGVVNFITQLPGKVGDLLTSMRNKAMDIFNGLLQDALNFGSNIIKNVANGIMNAIHFVTGAITNVTQWISDHLPHSPAKIGPLKDLAYQGQQIVQQISEGMLLNAPKMQMAMSQIVQPVANTVAASGAPSLTGAPSISNSTSNGGVANIYLTVNSQARNSKDLVNDIINELSQQLRGSGLMVNTPSGRRY